MTAIRALVLLEVRLEATGPDDAAAQIQRIASKLTAAREKSPVLRSAIPSLRIAVDEPHGEQTASAVIAYLDDDQPLRNPIAPAEDTLRVARTLTHMGNKMLAAEIGDETERALVDGWAAGLFGASDALVATPPHCCCEGYPAEVGGAVHRAECPIHGAPALDTAAPAPTEDQPLHFGYLRECPEGMDCQRHGCLQAHVPAPTEPTP